MSHHMMSHDRHGKIVHRPCSNCISSIENLMGTLSSSLCQLLNKEQLALFQLGVQLFYSKQCCLSGRFAPFQQWSAQLQIVSLIRSLCFLPTTVCNTVSNIVCQVIVLPSYTGRLHCCKSGHCAPFLQQQCHSQLALLTICSNLFQFILIYLNLF